VVPTPGTYVVINNSTAGYSATADGVIKLTGSPVLPYDRFHRLGKSKARRTCIWVTE